MTFELKPIDLSDDYESESMFGRPPLLSAIVPVLNESELIHGFLRDLRSIAPQAEIIVVDGGSWDGTPTIAGIFADLVISTKAGRAFQMNAGAAIARGEILWFLHADLQIPQGSPEMITAALSEPACVGGCFRLRFPSSRPIYRISDSLGNIGVEIFGFALGDHGIFCRRAVFREIGGYPEVPILEDAEIYRRLHRVGRMIQLSPEIVSSPRVYEANGPYRTTATYFLILFLYVVGVPIPSLNQIYRRFRHPETFGRGATDAAIS